MWSFANRRWSNFLIPVFTISTIFIMGLALRLFPGRDHFLWNNSDYGRDVYVMREMVANRDLKLLGPPASVFDQQQQAYLVFDGPLFYYFLAPFYAWSKGDPNLPLLANIIVHLSVLAPLGLITWHILKNKTAVYLTIFLGAVSYELIEYSRWLLNPALAVPFLAWFFYYLLKLYSQRRDAFWVGLTLGLAIQNQIFLLYWLVPVLLVLIFRKITWSGWLKVGIGLMMGLLPLVISELKFKFRATISLLNFFGHPQTENLSILAKFGRYFEHLNLVGHHNWWGFSDHYGWAAVLIILLIPLISYQQLSKSTKTKLPLLYLLFFSHSIIFCFNFYPSIYVDLGLGLILLILAVIGQFALWQAKLWWLSTFIVGVVTVSQLQLLVQNTKQGTPFGSHYFLTSDTLLFSDRLAVVAKIYELSAGQPFSLAVLDTPYGWPAVWASVFEQYQVRHQVALPKWYGFKVNGVPGDKVFTSTDGPLPTHVVLKQKLPVIDEATQKVFDFQQNQVSTLVQKIELNNMVIELRRARPEKL